MTRDEKYIARIIFKTKVHEAEKQAFEDLFTQVMCADSSHFKQVKPQGSLGDGKCDGFNEYTGEYYQVYAPEDLKGNEATALKKMEKSIDEIITTWTINGFDVKKCYFVVNDKFRSVYASAYTNAKALTKSKLVEVEIFKCSNLEDKFLSLDEDKIVSIVGMIPDPLNIDTIEYGVMTEVINYLTKSKPPKINEIIPKDPDFEQKILFNCLSEPVVEFLRAGRRQGFAVKDYFEFNSTFAKENLRIIFNGIYLEGVKEIPDSDTKNDEIFQYIVEKSSPRDTFAVHNAVYVLMAYYFEYCDIYETPTVNI